jgi:hypothetical protein
MAMSEYQFVAFRALDCPVTEANLKYMRRQSSRAEITPWSFENEYNFGDFHGNAIEMLRRGYDAHLHYANFGTRKLLIRLPGVPDVRALQPYVAEDSLSFLKDKKGTCGILSIDPVYEPGDLEDLWDIDAFFDRLVMLRGELLEGDLRPLYLAHLAVICDCEHDPGESREAPIPAGLGDLSDAQYALAELYGLSDALISAAARESPPMPARGDLKAHHEEWLRCLDDATKNAWLASLMDGQASAVRAEILSRHSADLKCPTWPTVEGTRTVTQLRAAAAEIARNAELKAAKKAVRRRTKRLAKMAANPEATLRESTAARCSAHA